MEENTFFARVESINETQQDTDTLRLLKEDDTGITIRVKKAPEDIVEQQTYLFECEEIIHKEEPQLKALTYTQIDQCKLTVDRRQELMEMFYDYAPVKTSDVQRIIESYLSQIENKVIKDITLAIYKEYEEAFYLYPAATKFHHAYIGGLSYHTSTMMKLIDGFLDVYPFLNKDLLIAGIILHDMCKVDELSNYRGPEYTTKGKLIGHITMGVKKVELVASKLNYIDKEEVMLLEHIILSHHYYGNYGSPKKTNLPEALILHFIDNIDSKVTVLDESLKLVEKGEFTSPIGVLDRQRYYKTKFDK
ncbi:MAG: HD domain-containing protein [Candidatus Izimaplasma sp.]|nr:HD domain-containing protein [Candidatus Izimaplasma bacterium]